MLRFRSCLHFNGGHRGDHYRILPPHGRLDAVYQVRGVDDSSAGIVELCVWRANRAVLSQRCQRRQKRRILHHLNDGVPRGLLLPRERGRPHRVRMPRVVPRGLYRQRGDVRLRLLSRHSANDERL
jgi:hypothetical protein